MPETKLYIARGSTVTIPIESVEKGADGKPVRKTKNVDVGPREPVELPVDQVEAKRIGGLVKEYVPPPPPELEEPEAPESTTEGEPKGSRHRAPKKGEE